MGKRINSIRRVLNRRTGSILPIAAAIIAASVVILGAAVWFFYLTINKTQLQNVVNSASLAAIEGFIEGSGGDDLSDEFYQKALKGKERAARILLENSGTLRGFSSQLGNIAFASRSEPFVPGPDHDQGGAITFGRWYSSAPANEATVAPSCAARSDADGHRYPCFEPIAEVPTAGVMHGADAVKVEACNENPISAPFSSNKQYVCEKSVATLVQRCVAFLVDLSYSQTYDSHKSLVEEVQFFAPGALNPPPAVGTSVSPTASPGANDIPRIVKPRLDKTLSWHPVSNPALTALPYYHDSVVGTLISNPNNCFTAATFQTANKAEAMYWCGMPDTRAGSSLPTQNTLHYKSDYRLRDYLNPKTGQWGQIWADVYASSNSSYLGPQPETTVFNAINAALRALEENTTSGDRVMMLTFNKSIVSVDPDPSEGMISDLGYLIQLTNAQNRGTIDENTAPNADGAQLHPNFLDKGWIPVLGEDSDKTNAALALDYTAEVMKQNCPATSVRSIVVFTDGLSNCARHYVDSTHPAVTIDPKYNSYLQPTNYQYSCYNGTAADQLAWFSRFGNQLNGAVSSDGSVSPLDNQSSPSIATVLKQNAIALTAIIAGNTVAPNTIEVPVPGSNGQRYYTQDELAALGWGGRSDGDWNSIYRIADYFAHFPPPSPPSGTSWITYAGMNIPKIGYYFGGPNPVWAGTVMDTGGTFCPIRPKCKKGGDLMEQPPCNSNGSCTAGSEYISDASNTSPGAPRVINPNCLISEVNGNSANPYQGCNRDDHETAGGVLWNKASLTCSYYERTESEQAADCAVKTVSGNPYILVAQDKD